MDKITELSKEQKNEDKMLIANVLDKIKIVQKRNGFENTHFLNMQEQALIEEQEEIIEEAKEIDYEEIFNNNFEKYNTNLYNNLNTLFLKYQFFHQ